MKITIEVNEKRIKDKRNPIIYGYLVGYDMGTCKMIVF